MATITRLKVKGLRRFLHLDLPFKSFMVFIDANGSGKTTFLEALALLSASTTGNLNKAITDLGGFASLITRDVADSLSVTVEMAVPEYPSLVYELELIAKGNSYAISKETLSQVRPGFATPFHHINSSYDDIRYFSTDAQRLIRPSWAHNPWETSLSQVPKMFQQPEEFRQLLAAATQEVVVLDVNERGFTTATWADTMDLDHWLAAYTLDQVWQLGRMGGRS